MWRSGTKQRGFTLLEVLIAVSILGIMLTLLFGSFAICSRSWKTGDEYIRQVEQMAMVQNFFRTHLSGAWGQPDLAQNNSEADNGGLGDLQEFQEWAFFQGREQYLQFVSLLPESAARGGWYLFKVGIKPNTASLYVSMTPFLPLREHQRPASEDLEILADVESLKIYYWGLKPDEDASKWHSEWINMSNLPEMISINIKLRKQSAWPTLVVAPRRAPAQFNNSLAANAQG